MILSMKLLNYRIPVKYANLQININCFLFEVSICRKQICGIFLDAGTSILDVDVDIDANVRGWG